MLLALALALAIADECQTSVGGICMDEAACQTSTVAGLCPGGSTNKCCFPSSACSARNGRACIDTSQATCSGNTAKGLCPGDATVVCCTPSAAAPAAAPGGGSCGATAPASSYNMGMNGVRLVAVFEGFDNNCYRDTEGIWTIGYGHACQDDSDNLPQVRERTETRERERERQTETEARARERERRRARERERKRDRDRERETETERQRQRERLT